jgi:hypothetical protein
MSEYRARPKRVEQGHGNFADIAVSPARSAFVHSLAVTWLWRSERWVSRLHARLGADQAQRIIGTKCVESYAAYAVA